MTTLSFARRETGRRDLETLRDRFGTLACSRLDDPEITDLLLNDGFLFEDRESTGLSYIGAVDDHDAQAAIEMVASFAGEIVNRNSPYIEATLPIRNARFIGYIQPITQKPCFAIRLPAAKIYTFEDYVIAQIATGRQIEILEDAVRKKQNILIAAGTKAGKSTLLNAILEAHNRFHPDMRIGLMEEIVELQYQQRNVLALRTGTDIDHQHILKLLMRSRPDALVVGEVRDKAAMTLVKASNTGHEPVLSTIHANSARAALGRMEDLCGEALPGVSVRNQIADALGIIVGIKRIDPADRLPGEPARRITEIIQIEGVTNGNYELSVLA